MFGIYLGLFVAMDQMKLDALQEMRADDDGMAQPYIRLEGIKTPRMLSWAEERALRHDLAEGANAVLTGAWYASREWRHGCIVLDDPGEPHTPEQRAKALAWWSAHLDITGWELTAGSTRLQRKAPRGD